MNLRTVTLAITSFLAALFLDVSVTTSSETSNAQITIGLSTSHARDREERREDRRQDRRQYRRQDNRQDRRQDHRQVRRIARRTARRVNRRHDHYYSLPPGCKKVFVLGDLYYYCGGIYYQETIDNDDKVYIIVNL